MMVQDLNHVHLAMHLSWLCGDLEPLLHLLIALSALVKVACRDFHTEGTWSEGEGDMHINFLEFLRALLAL